MYHISGSAGRIAEFAPRAQVDKPSGTANNASASWCGRTVQSITLGFTVFVKAILP